MTHGTVGEGELAAYLIEEQQQASIRAVVITRERAVVITRERAAILTIPQRRRKQICCL